MDLDTIEKLYTPLRVSSVKSTNSPPSASLIWDRKHQFLVSIENNEDGDSALAVLKKIPWWKIFFHDYILISTHIPSLAAIKEIKRRHIKHVYYFDYFQAKDSLKELKRRKINHTRLIMTKK